MKNKIAIIVPPNPNADPKASYEKAKLHGLVHALEMEKMIVQTYYYSDDKVSELELELQKMDAVLVWINPIENNKNRAVLDGLLIRLSLKKIFISTHPDSIVKMGTKEVLYKTKTLDWGCDVEVYRTKQDFSQRFIKKLRPNISRVLKQNRGNGGNGVWRIELARGNTKSKENSYVKVLHALRDSKEEEMPLNNFITKIQNYFDNNGMIIDQEFISPEPNGMVRCYISQNKVVGFGHQYVKNLLRPKIAGEVLESQPRIYFSKDKPEYQDLRKFMETSWIDQMSKILHIQTQDLPVLWDADFLYRANPIQSQRKYVLCEINVSSVYPFPETAVPDVVNTIKNILGQNS